MVRKPKFEPGDILEVLWSGSTPGIIKVDFVKTVNDTTFYIFSHLSGYTRGRTYDERCIKIVEDALQAKRAALAARVLYEY